jgi:replication initiation and membrane attachment protein DnaB
MRKYTLPQPQRVRRIEKSFAWIDHRLLRNGYLQVMTHQDLALYLFLVMAADRHGISFYRKEKICDAIGLDWEQFEKARSRLIDFGLIAFEPYSALTPNGVYQVLPVDGQPPDFTQEVFRRLDAGRTMANRSEDKSRSAVDREVDPVAWAHS